MSDVLISLVGGRSLPNILLALHRKPDYHYLFVSQDSVDTDLKDTMEALPEQLKTKCHIVHPHKIGETISVSEKIISAHSNHKIAINVSAGPKTMAFGAYEAAKRAFNEGIQIELIYLGGGYVYSIFQTDNPTESVNIGIEDYLSCYGWHITTKNEEIPSKLKMIHDIFSANIPLTMRLLQSIRTPDTQGKGKRTVRIRPIPEDQSALLKKAEEHELLNNITYSNDGMNFTINDDNSWAMITGGDWLEYHVFNTANNIAKNGAPLFDECAWGVEDKNKKGELDFIGVISGQLVVASCKTDKKLKRSYFEDLRSKVSRLGAGMCSALLVSTVPRQARDDSCIDDYERWADQNQISLVMLEDIPNLEKIFMKIIKCDAETEPHNIKCYSRI